MPRVHGIDIVPRRGRGRGRPHPSVAYGSVVGGGGATSCIVERTSTADGDVDDDGDGGGGGGIGIHFARVIATSSPVAAPPPGSKSAEKSNGQTTSAVETRTGQNAAIESTTTTAVGTGTVGTAAEISSIRPQAREVLDHYEFGSRSFSVQEISRKEPPSHYDPDRSRSGSIGIGESSDAIRDLPTTMSTRDLAATTTDLVTREYSEAHESRPTEELERVVTKDGSQRLLVSQNRASKADGNSIHDCNAYWLYQRCSAACIQMGTPLSPLELSIEILRFIRSMEDEDDLKGNLHRKLFELMRDAKRRDLDLIYDVAERLGLLKEDAALDERSIRKVATHVGGISHTNRACDVISVDKDNNAYQEPIADSSEPMTPHYNLMKSLGNVQLHEEQQKISPRKVNRSRRRKCPTQNTNTATNMTGGAEVESSHIGATNLTNEKMPSTETNKAANETILADFSHKIDALNMQDDEKWSLLTSDRLQSFEDTRIEVTCEISQRVTRSMGATADNYICEASYAKEHSAGNGGSPELCRMADGAETTDSSDERNVKNTENYLAESAGEEKKQDNDLRTKNEVSICYNSSRDNEQSTLSNVVGVVHEAHQGAKDSQINGERILVKTRTRSEGKDTVRIMFTGFTATRRLMQMIETIGAEYVESIEEAHTATHVIASDGVTALRRTPKLMICICRVAKILSLEWLEQSSKEQRILDTHDFLLLGDREAEKRYNFSMKDTLRNGILARKRRGGVLGGWFVYICSGVAGNRAPNMKELQLIIVAGGGQVLKSLSDDKFDPVKTIVLTSEPSTQSQLKERGVKKVQSIGAKILTTSWLFHTIITQQLIDIDDKDNSDSANDRSQTSRSVRSKAEILDTKVSEMSVPPGMTVAVKSSHHTSTDDQDSIYRLDEVDSARIRGSNVSHLQCAPSSTSRPKKNVLDILPSQKLSEPATNQKHFYSHKSSLASSFKALSVPDDMAAVKTHELWFDYFRRVRINASNPLANRPKRGVRCLRGRKRSISPLVTSTNPSSLKSPIEVKNGNHHMSPSSMPAHNVLFEDNSFVTWEAYVLFVIGLRADEIGVHESITSAALIPANWFFPRPIAINNDDSVGKSSDHDQASPSPNKLSLKVDARELGGDEAWEIFGSLQDLFSLHQQYQTSGMIPEQVVALLSLRAIEAVAAMHSCGIVHNDICLDSFLVVKRTHPVSSHNNHDNEIESGSWFLQVVGFGNKAVIVDRHEIHENCIYAHDYQCLANVIHLFLTGGVEISLITSRSGTIEFTSKAFLKGNLFLRGALSWCSLIDALMSVGELTPQCDKSEGRFRLEFPVSNLTASDDERDGRINQFIWSCRVLRDLADDYKLADLMVDLCSNNYRFIFPETNLSSFVCNTRDDKQSFLCYKSNAQTVSHLMERECKLHADALALAQRETELNKKKAQFEQFKLEHRMKENELFKREKTQAREAQRLETLKEELNRRQRRVEQRIILLDDYASKQNKLHPDCLIANKEAEAHFSARSNYLLSLSGLKASQGSDPSPRSIDSLPHHYSPNAAGLKRKSDIDLQSLTQDFESTNGGSQESQWSAGSIKGRKTGSFRKSPKCSLHSLPTRSPTPKKQTPKKVYIDLQDD